MLLLLMNVVCIGVGVGIAALVSYPLYWGLLAGWLCPSVAVVALITALATLDDSHSGQSLSISHPITRNIHT